MSILTSVLGRSWQARVCENRVSSSISQQMGLPNVVAQLLVSRGIESTQAVNDFLNPTLKSALCDPFLLKDMDKAVDILAEAVIQNKKVAIFGDYDVDGATSTALFRRYFDLLEKEITVYIPDRIEEGYGPNVPALTKLVDQGHEVIVTVDCGTTSFDPFDAIKDLPVQIIVIDHHKAEAKLPKVDALVNPCRLDAPLPTLQHLAAVGLCFMTLVALNKKLRNLGFFKDVEEPDLRTLLDIVAVGTVADVVKLTGINRAFVTQGLKVLRKRLNVGLKALCDVANLSSSPDAYHLGFVIGPRINAGGRVGKADLGTQLLSTNDEDLAAKLSQELNAYNQERQEIEASVLESAVSQVEQSSLKNSSCLVVGGDQWHPGVIGIVASRLKEKYQRPVAVISFDEQGIGKGSGRSVEGIDFGSFVHKAKHQGLLDQGGGHAMAVGFSVEKNKEAAFRSFLDKEMAPLLNDNIPTQYYDLELSIDGATLELVEHLEHLAPFGMGNPMPKFRFQNARLSFAEIVGKDHIKCRFSKSDKGQVEAIAFRAVDTPLGDMLLSQKGKTVDLVGSLRKDTWMGYDKVKLFVEDILLSN